MVLAPAPMRYRARVSSTREAALPAIIARALARPGPCLFLTGAGISAESGVPTFRGKEGYWVVGSRHYHPEELATRAAFGRMPAAIWRWYLHRLRVCRGAQPNLAHQAIAGLAHALGDRFLLITQNVDGLHPRAGTPRERTYEVHGNIAWMRCSRGCEGLALVPEELLASDAAERLESADRAGGAPPPLLGCARCAAWMRPHVLWFDEHYDEASFRFDSSLRAVDSAALLVVVGTTGTTNLPLQIGERAVRRGVPTLVINPEPNAFSALVQGQPETAFLQGTAGHWVPRVVALVRDAGAGVAVNPESNLKLASGVPDIAGWLAAGLKLGLGTDGAASNNDLDMFDTMRTTAMLHMLIDDDPRSMPAQTVLEMATIGGARSLGLGDRLGSLEPGKLADVIVVRMDTARQTPLYNPVSHLVYVTRGDDVRTSIINGKVIMRDRQVLTLDAAKVIADANAMAACKNH